MAVDYLKLLEGAPGNHESKEFKMWLLNSNNIMEIGEYWFGLYNIKYHTNAHTAYVFFPFVNEISDNHILEMWKIRNQYNHLAFYNNRKDDKSVGIEHFHLTSSSISGLIETSLMVK